MTPKLLIIAGLDPSGNAGVLKDAEMALRLKIRPSAVVTALTAQNNRRFFASQVVASPVFDRQLKSVLSEEWPAVKIGMLGSASIVRSTIRSLSRLAVLPPVIVDPVIESSTGGSLLDLKGRKILFDKLVPMAALWTPNLPEASFFAGKSVRTKVQIEGAAQALWLKTGTPVLIKGGHSPQSRSVDSFFFDGTRGIWNSVPRLKYKFRGTGCSLATLIAGFVVKGNALEKAVIMGERELQKVLREIK